MKDGKDKYTKDLEIVFRGRPPSPDSLSAKMRQQILRKRELEQGIVPLQMRVKKTSAEAWKSLAKERGLTVGELIEQAMTAFTCTQGAQI